MRKYFSIFLVVITGSLAYGQSDLYFPPTDGSDTWETLNFTELDWCQEKVDSLDYFLEAHDSKGFIVLKNGKIVLENYYGTFTQDSLWYWASAGKSLTAFLTGLAQEQGYLSVDEPTSDYLGEGWTSCPPDKEQLITIKHQISMTTGLDHNVDDLDCLTPECLQYLTDAGNDWFYHNAPYRLVQDVIGTATGTNLNLWTHNELGSKIGMGGAWYDYVRFSKTRDLARFGLLMNARGVWDADTIMHDQEYFNSMISPSQDLNPSYGYLWWLNGQDEMMLPQFTFTLPGPIVPSAPESMYAALGKNDQKIYVVPDQDLVVVRVGNSASENLLALTTFDIDLWEILGDMSCETSISELDRKSQKIFPNPVRERLKFTGFENYDQLEIKVYSSLGKLVLQEIASNKNEIDISGFPVGSYIIEIKTEESSFRSSFIVDR